MAVKTAQNKPFFIGRMSGNENYLAGMYMQKRLPPVNFLIQNMLHMAGIQFRDDGDILKYYVEMYNKSLLNTDLLGVWDGSLFNQAKIQYDMLNTDGCLDAKRICAQAVEPYYFLTDPEYSFNQLFKNKKVLIISSHKHTIDQQIPKLPLIFPKPLFDPSTTFFTYKPPQQNAGSHDQHHWKYHFDNMAADLKHIKENKFNFDVALVSCGGFGMPISDYIFSDLHTSAIYVGGALQLFFGIQGERWQSSKFIQDVKNEHWTTVLDSDKPRNPRLCENSCYW